ncbi:hypothetical protein [Spirosoma aerolatum]|uniref:hypothetical protein n=1 Tax=Spirosoma aerolatum TaxID=1211326 RepID=UPI0009AD9FF2|nr:hypothetical protein [Spirosoma aerolatum]
MQLDFTREHSVAEKYLQLRDLKGRNLYVVVHCGRYQIIHTGKMLAINDEGTVLALNCPTEKNRNEYGETDFIQHERTRNQWGELIKPTERFQYIPIALISKIIDYSVKNSA